LGRMAAVPPGYLKDGICSPICMINLLLDIVHRLHVLSSDCNLLHR
jgi:hypothetical protein